MTTLEELDELLVKLDKEYQKEKSAKIKDLLKAGKFPYAIQVSREVFQGLGKSESFVENKYKGRDIIKSDVLKQGEKFRVQRLS